VLPDLSCNSAFPDSLCCESLWDTANHILGKVTPRVMECITACDCCNGNFYAYVSQGEPEVWASDYLAIWLQNISPSIRSTSPTNTTHFAHNLMRAQWAMRICEGGYPHIEADIVGIPELPGFDLLHYTNRYVYSHGEQMFRALMQAVKDQTLTPRPSTFTLQAFGPIRMERGSAGYQVTFQTDVDFE
jgi:hypothetical protein